MRVRLENVTKRFDQVTAVNDFTVTFDDGQLTGLLGPSGCGKSTLLFLLAGLHEVTNGNIFFDDENVTHISPEKRGIGLVFQNYALYPHMTAEQNIMFPLENLKMPKDEAKRVVQEMAELVHIGELLKRKPSQMSGGQQQRVAIARALAKRPRVLLLDEPLSNLDARLRLMMREEIKRIQRETGITAIFVTHDQEEAMSISDSIIIMNQGVLQQKAPPQFMYNNPINEFVAKFLGNPPINMIDAEIKNNNILIGSTLFGKCTAPDQKVHLGIRPEGFIIDDQGPLKANIESVEYIGRDTMLRFHLNGHPIRAILDSNLVFDEKSLSLETKDISVFVFDMQGNRINV